MPEEGQQYMWVMVFFDLPVVTAREKRHYRRFRKHLQRDGFLMIQFSVYARLCNGMQNAQMHVDRVRKALPPAGSVRSMVVTDKQYARMKVLLGTRTDDEDLRGDKPEQLLLI